VIYAIDCGIKDANGYQYDIVLESALEVIDSRRRSFAERIVPGESLIDIVNGFRIGHSKGKTLVRMIEDLPGSKVGFCRDELVVPVERGGLGYQGVVDNVRRLAQDQEKLSGDRISDGVQAVPRPIGEHK
jgi:hypothetical protein